ncbi:MAG TPA: hypothetical protein VHS59_00890, partial [Bacillota bacterium]|nr:hypothetical protein [Bacillota bacterium]
AEKFMQELRPVLGIIIPKLQQNMISQSREIAMFDDTTFGNLESQMKTPYQQPYTIMAGSGSYC